MTKIEDYQFCPIIKDTCKKQECKLWGRTKPSCLVVRLLRSLVRRKDLKSG